MFARDEKKGMDRAEKQIIGYFGKGVDVEGKLVFEGTIRIEGHFKGEIKSAGTLIVGEGGVVEGDVKVDTAIITGEIRGTIEGKSRVELNAPAKVFGDVKTPTLIVCEGVIFEGKCLMGGSRMGMGTPSLKAANTTAPGSGTVQDI